MIIKSQLIFVIIILHSSTLFGNVKFNFIYADEPGTGFHAKPEAKTALEEVGELIGCDWLKHHEAVINLKVFSEDDPNENQLASAVCVDHKSLIKDGFFHSYLGKKIIFGQDNEDKEFDGIIKVNFHYDYGFEDTINSEQLDFKSTLIHEITHALGFLSTSSSCPKTIIELLEENLDDFIKKLFIYGINEIQGNPQDIELSFLTERLNLFQSNEIDIEKYILDEAYSSVEKLIAQITLEFKTAITSHSSILSRTYPLLDELNNVLSQKGMIIQDTIALDQETETILPELMSLGLHILSGDSIVDVNISKMKQLLIKQDLLHDGFNEYIINGLERMIDQNPESKDTITLTISILITTIEYIMNNGIETNKIQEISKSSKDVLDHLGLSYQELSNLFSNPDKKSFSFFDQFIIEKNSKTFFDKNYKEKIIDKCLLNNNDENKQLFFSGPNTLKYLDTPIPLNGMDSSHISPLKKSIMNHQQNYGPEPKEWDDCTTAIMLDLGYKVDNYWTRLWTNQETSNKTEL